jgi:hypothetical protein
MESGHKNAGDAERIFHEVKNELVTLNCHILSTITFAGKNDGDPLMVADYLAYGTLKLEEAGRNGLDEGAYVGPRPKGTGMTHLAFHADGLATLKFQLAEGLKKGGGWRATFLAPSSSGGEMAE